MITKALKMKNRKLEVAFWFLILFICVSAAVGQDEPAVVNNDLAVESAVETGPASTIQSITFKKDMRIVDALRFLAAKYQKNIVPSPSVDGVVMVGNLYDVTFDEALKAILGHGFKYEADGNFIRVYTAEEYKKVKEDKGRMVYRTFTLYYISAFEAVKLVAPVLSQSALVQSTSPAQTGVSTSDDGVGSTFGGDTVALNDHIVVYDFPENIEKAAEVIASVDQRPQQVLVEATILSASLTEDTQLGVDMSNLNGVTITNLLGVGGGQNGFSSTGFTALEGDGGMRVGITNDHVAVLIRALEDITDITIMANPKILALNKQMGTVFIGTKLGYQDRTTISDTGQATVGEIKFLDTGTKLSFRPYIANDGYIRMDIYPKDSSGSLDNDGIPSETTAELVTNIMVQDGKTIVIGGLFRDDITSGRSQIPLLGDLPIIGAAFRYTSDVSVRKEIIVMLTPHIINDSSETDPENRAADIERKRSGAHNELQGLGRARIAEDHYISAVEHYTANNFDAALSEVNKALNLRPTYLEAIRLKERMLCDITGCDTAQMNRILLENVEKEDASNWRRW
ncbi:MAG: hypothetical protein PHF37_09950 [Phycisphaerae bacterium]|nr:hypothetical protein [Phycisphaerae bacterium]